MPVVRTTITVTAPWTSQSMLDGFQQAFTAAGFSSFVDTLLSGSFRSAILPVTYDPTKALGAAYHWFMFSGQEIFYSTMTGWNTTTKAPTGVQYRDFISNLTNTSVGHYRLAELNTNADTTITVYRSTANTNFAWFLVRCGTIAFNFHIPRTPPSADFYDQNVDYYHPILHARAAREGKGGSITIARLPLRLRSSGCGGEGLRGSTSLGDYGASNTSTLPWGISNRDVMAVFNIPGNFNLASSSDQNTNFSRSGMILPARFANTNSYLTLDKTPIFQGARLLYFADHFLPSDFGIVGYYGPPNAGQLDRYKNGNEFWDIIEVPSSAANPVDDDQVTPLFIANTPP